MNELIPCPGCGAVKPQVVVQGATGPQVQCMACGTRGPCRADAKAARRAFSWLWHGAMNRHRPSPIAESQEVSEWGEATAGKPSLHVGGQHGG